MSQRTVGDLRNQLISHLTSISTEAQAGRVEKRMQQMTDKEVYSLRLMHKESVNQLVCDLCELLPLPLHKSQSRIRHISEDVRFLLFDRFLTALSFLNELPSDDATLPDFDTDESMLKFFLIDVFESRLASVSSIEP